MKPDGRSHGSGVALSLDAMSDQRIFFWFLIILVLLFAHPAPAEQDNQAAAAGPERTTARKRAAPPSPRRSDGPTRFELKNIHFRIDETVILEIAYLRGELLSLVKDAPPTFDDKTSLLMKIEAGEAAMSTAAFSDLLNRYVFNYPDTPLTNIKVSTQGSQIKQEATMRKGVAVPTEMLGTLGVLPDGRIRFHPTTIKAAGVPSTTLRDFFGIEVSELIKGTASRGVEIVGDDLIMDLNRMLPPPRVQARVTAVRIEGNRIVQSFGATASSATQGEDDLTPADPSAPNYMFYRGGTLRFGKLTMADADLQVVDAGPEDPLDFFLDRYYDQLVAGYTKNMPDKGLVAVVPDFYQLRDPDGTGPNLTPED